MNFTPSDLEHIQSLGLSLETIKKQIKTYKGSPNYINLSASAKIGNGILKLSESDWNDFINYYDDEKNALKVVKFTPASGAASRMFKLLQEFLSKYDPQKETINSYINKNKSVELFLFFVTIEKLPFHDEVVDKMQLMMPDYDLLNLDQKRLLFVKSILEEDYLNYSNIPKGLLPFHQYQNHTSTAFEEHLFEASKYASVNGKAQLHFTVSKAHLEQFKTKWAAIQSIVESKTNTKFKISFSCQESNTNVLAVDLKNQPFRLNDKLFFRPSGHGALIKNLNQIDANIIFIKNIDNVVVDRFLERISGYKKGLAGVLLKLQSQVFKYAKVLESTEISDVQIVEIVDFLTQKLNICVSSEFNKYAYKYQIDYLKSKINRPIRVCGMVENEGEPGGGPFWVKAENGEISLQIVEASQVNLKLSRQKTILMNATHFNPVDIVCGIKNYKGETYDLKQFIDPKTYFITKKSKYGKQLKTLEQPGLWNGSMAHWNTVFVEVPIITFNPVKTVNDLLKFTHQAK